MTPFFFLIYDMVGRYTFIFWNDVCMFTTFCVFLHGYSSSKLFNELIWLACNRMFSFFRGVERSQIADHPEECYILVSIAFHSVGIVEGMVLKVWTLIWLAGQLVNRLGHVAKTLNKWYSDCNGLIVFVTSLAYLKIVLLSYILFSTQLTSFPFPSYPLSHGTHASN